MLLSLLLLATAAYGLDWKNTKYVYAFGDSYSYVEGTNGLANFSFIGNMLNISFTPQQLLSTEIVTKHTSSDGSNWLQFLTGCHSGLPSVCKRQLWDFSFAGADIDQNLLPLHHDYTIPLVNQVDQFITYALPYLPKGRPYETLVAWWIGINDTGDSINNHTISDWDAFWDAELDSYFQSVNKLDGKLNRPCHLFLSVPPGERSPNTLGNAAKAAIQEERIASFNTRLIKRISNMKTCVQYFDAHQWFHHVLDNFEQYGFKNITGTGTSEGGYFWYNAGHPTEPVHRLLAESVTKQLE